MVNEKIKRLKESDRNGGDWFNAYQEIDIFLFSELDKIGKEFPIVNEERPYLNTIEAIKLLITNTELK